MTCWSCNFYMSSQVGRMTPIKRKSQKARNKDCCPALPPNGQIEQKNSALQSSRIMANETNINKYCNSKGTPNSKQAAYMALLANNNAYTQTPHDTAWYHPCRPDS